MLINFLLLFSVLCLFSGLAVDAGMLQLRKLQLQHAADAAALGAIYEKARGSSVSVWQAAGKSDAALNGFTDGVNGVTISIVSPPTSGSYSGVANAIQATVKQTYHAAFMGMLSGGANVTPGMSAVAAGSTNPNCVYIMGAGGFLYWPLNINLSSNLTSGCGIYVDSTSNSINVNIFNTLAVTGGNSIDVQGSSGGSVLLSSPSPYPTFNSSNENDPLAWETAPTFSSCNYTGKSVAFGSATLNPGTYCGGISLNAANVTFNPGLYIVTGGMFWQGLSTINGTGVTFYLTNGGGYSYGNFLIWSSTVNLTAPTSTSGGGLTGIVVFVDRNWADNGSQGIQFLNSTITTNGIWYALNTGISNTGTTLKGTTYMGMVVDNITTNLATFTFPTPDYSSISGSPFQGGSVGGLVE